MKIDDDVKKALKISAVIFASLPFLTLAFALICDSTETTSNSKTAHVTTTVTETKPVTSTTSAATTTTVTTTTTTTPEAVTTVPEAVTTIGTEEAITTIVPEETEATVPEPPDEDQAQIDFHNMCKDVVNVNEGIDCYVVELKITPSFSSKLTIHAAYFDAEKIIKNDLFKRKYKDNVEKVMFWAKTDFADGSERKFIQFEMSTALIDQINSDEYMVPPDYSNYVENLWLANGLTE